MQAPVSEVLYSVHDIGGERILLDAGVKGSIVDAVQVGHDPNNTEGADYRFLAEKDIQVFCRVDNSYHANETIPDPEHYGDFATRVASFVKNTQGCDFFVIANEPNMGGFDAFSYAECFDAVYKKAKAARPDAQILLGAVAPWNATMGDWVQYQRDMIESVEAFDGVVLHAYTHGSDPDLVFSDATMDWPYEDRFYNFRVYRDFCSVVPAGSAIYILETDQDVAWADVNSGWVKNVYEEINEWNSTHGQHVIRAVTLFRWQNTGDKWSFGDKEGVKADLRDAMTRGHTWPDKETDMPEEWIEIVRDHFNEFHDQDDIDELTIPVGADGVEYVVDWREEPGDGNFDRPECDSRDLRDGDDGVDPDSPPLSAAVFKPHSTLEGALYRSVPVQPGRRVRFRFRAWIISKEQENDNDGAMGTRAGIDPSGGIYYKAGSVQYGEWFDVREKPQNQRVWTWIYSPEVIAQTDRIHVFLWYSADFAVDLNAIHFDQVIVEMLTDDPVDPPVEPPIEPPTGPIGERLRAIGDDLIAYGIELQEIADVVDQSANPQVCTWAKEIGALAESIQDATCASAPAPQALMHPLALAENVEAIKRAMPAMASSADLASAFGLDLESQLAESGPGECSGECCACEDEESDDSGDS